ncbi:SRPBCC domain-containing protein [Pedobacter frigiditerrae]|uniref:SRPBCC domain-containing protein n=1 Tax=Pedobacter frigiditerrae TaxID=2530452 RepID=A0A4R0MN86_9SPHI|nr:SRPBCC domain-containing protein [Pedobacter frigiditerrae]TCC88228.1 SRPBCC domain-containing protein [Pedobacter frigiditerrae]
MKSNLLFDFIVNKEEKTIVVKREFAAELELVWEAWTSAEFLEQWIAPKPWRAETKTMDFKEGGFWHYAMISPQDEKHWSRYDYQSIEPLKSITELRGFSDESGAINPDFPRTLCTNVFDETEGNTFVTVTAQYGSLKVLEYMVTHGFKEGMSAALANLDELLLNLKK